MFAAGSSGKPSGAFSKPKASIRVYFPQKRHPILLGCRDYLCRLKIGRFRQYQKAGLPLLVDAEFGIWRKVIDHDGTAGWMHGSVLSLRRMALVQKNMAKIHANPDETSNVIALAERLALMELQSCPKAWCRVANNDVRGWIKRQAVWGLLETESLD